jgi:soluble lytic murein transglycosylase-like protein
MALDKETLDKLFCLNAKKYRIPKLWLKAVAMVESSMNQRAYRYEPEFWKNYMRDKPEWAGKDPSVVSASYGLMQLMWTTAVGLGFTGTPEELYDPVYNIELGAKLIRQLLDKVMVEGQHNLFPQWSALDMAMARYNGGRRGNPDEKGGIRNLKYILKVRREWVNYMEKEVEC